MRPEKLVPGDVIGIIAPSDPITPELESRLARGIAFFEAKGFNCRLGQHCKSQKLGFAAGDEEKAADINTMFADPEVKAVICAQGGDSANAPLTRIDWGLIRNNPKIFLGISDITVLLNAIHQMTGLITFHGSDLLWGFGREPDPYDWMTFDRTLIKGDIGPIPPNRPRRCLRKGTASGPLLGGNLRCLLKLAGTPFWPDVEDAVLFLEAFHITPKSCYTNLIQLKQMGLFKQISGAVVGYVDSMQKDNGKGPFMEDILLMVSSEYTFPILKINDFGHNCPNTPLPVGGRVGLNAGALRLEIESPCVK